MTASPLMHTALLIGGPGHGRFVSVRENQQVVRLPVPKGPSFWTQPLSAGELEPWDEVEYRPRDLFIFGRVLRIWVPDYLCQSAMEEAAFNLLLSDKAKGVAL